MCASHLHHAPAIQLPQYRKQMLAQGILWALQPLSLPCPAEKGEQ